MQKSPEDMRSEYESGCTHFRNRGVVSTVDGAVVFNGKTERHEGVNSAKRYVRSNSLKSYTIRK